MRASATRWTGSGTSQQDVVAIATPLSCGLLARRSEMRSESVWTPSSAHFVSTRLLALASAWEEEAFAEAWAQGSVLAREDAIEYGFASLH